MNETPNVTPETPAAETITPLVVDPSRLRCPVCSARLVAETCEDSTFDPLADGALICPTGVLVPGVGTHFRYTPTPAVRALAAYLVVPGTYDSNVVIPNEFTGRVKVYPHAGRAFKHALAVSARIGKRVEVVNFATGEIVGIALVPVKPAAFSCGHVAPAGYAEPESVLCAPCTLAAVHASEPSAQ